MKTPQLSAAIYIRVSTRDQALEGYSLDAQERVLSDYCKSHRYNIYRVYKDEGLSGKSMKHRPEVLQLMEDAEQKKFDIVLIWKITRFSRSFSELVASCEHLDKIGVRLISYSEAFDSETPAGRMVRSMLGTVAQFEREVIAENVALGMLERARQGKRTCRTVLGYAPTENDSLKEVPEEAERVRFIFKTYRERKCILETTFICREKGLRGKKGKLFTTESIHKILTNPLYAGYNRYKGEIYKGFHPAIISPKYFNATQRLIARQGRLTGRKREEKLYIVPED